MLSGSCWFADFLWVRGCQRLGQPIEQPSSPRPSGTGISLFQDAGAQSAGLFSKRLSEARAAIERSRLGFVKAIFFRREANLFKHQQLFFSSSPHKRLIPIELRLERAFQRKAEVFRLLDGQLCQLGAKLAQMKTGNLLV
jgi:hypothetical protein